MKKFTVNGISIEAEDHNDARQIFLDDHLDVQEEILPTEFYVHVTFYKTYKVEASCTDEAEDAVIKLAEKHCEKLDVTFEIEDFEEC